MNTYIKLTFTLGLIVSLCENIAFSHDVPVHILITRAAAQTAYGSSTAFQDFLNSVATGNGANDINYGLAENYLILGSAFEDGPYKAPFYFTSSIGGQIITFPVEFDLENGVWKVVEV